MEIVSGGEGGRTACRWRFGNEERDEGEKERRLTRRTRFFLKLWMGEREREADRERDRCRDRDKDTAKRQRYRKRKKRERMGSSLSFFFFSFVCGLFIFSQL
jgi:Zn-finger nucleic acid-binding protein